MTKRAEPFCRSSDDIEHGILRKNSGHPVVLKRQFLGFDRRHSFYFAKKDPRIHFALVCASSSCPPIEFYDATRIDDQLDAAGRSFINRNGMLIDRKRSILLLSQVFKWYRNDFGKNEREMIRFVMEFADSGSREYILANLGSIKVEYLPYDWNLNNALK